MKFCDLQPKTPGTFPAVTFSNNETRLSEPRTDDGLSPTQEGKPPTPPPWGHSAGAAHAPSSRSFSARGEHRSHSLAQPRGRAWSEVSHARPLNDGNVKTARGTSRKGALVPDGSQPRPLPPASASAAHGGCGQPQARPGPCACTFPAREPDGVGRPSPGCQSRL